MSIEDEAPYEVINCARCGFDHEGLEPKPLRQPHEPEGPETYTHWTPCPTNGQPILWAVVEDTRDDDLTARLNVLVGELADTSMHYVLTSPSGEKTEYDVQPGEVLPSNIEVGDHLEVQRPDELTVLVEVLDES